MRLLRKSDERGAAHHGWLQSKHTFSFGDYHDPNFMGFGPLRVINEDIVAPDEGFGRHPHHDMEIFSYVVSGELSHRDSLGNGRIIRAGELQAMSAGAGVTHSEFNASKSVPVHFLQIWIIPEKRGLMPTYSEWIPMDLMTTGGLTLLASPDSTDGSIKMNQDARMYLGQLETGQSIDIPCLPERRVWLQMIKGELHQGQDILRQGDGLGMYQESSFSVSATAQSAFLLFDMVDLH